MRLLPGIIVGILLTIGGVYLYDSTNTSRVSNGDSVTVGRTIVNWDVASADWDLIKIRTREKWDQLASNIK